MVLFQQRKGYQTKVNSLLKCSSNAIVMLQVYNTFMCILITLKCYFRNFSYVDAEWWLKTCVEIYTVPIATPEATKLFKFCFAMAYPWGMRATIRPGQGNRRNPNRKIWITGRVVSSDQKFWQISLLENF